MYNPAALYGQKRGSSTHSETSWEEETVKSSVINDEEASYLEESVLGDESFAGEEETVDGSKVGSTKEQQQQQQQQQAARTALQKSQARKVFVKAAQLAAEGGNKGGNHLEKGKGANKTMEKEGNSNSEGISSEAAESDTLPQITSTTDDLSKNASSSKEKAQSRRLKAREELARLNQQLAQQTIQDNDSAEGNRGNGANANVNDNGALGYLTLK